MSFEDIQSQHIRLAILRLLEKAGGNYSANDSIVADALPPLGFAAGRDRVRAELGWLRDSGLVTVETIGGLMVATLTGRGLDVATGRTIVEGVKRPAPGG